MDNWGNYPREKFDPFSVMLFKGLQVVAFLFFVTVSERGWPWKGDE